MKEKALALITIILITTTLIGVAYTHWSGKIEVHVKAHIGILKLKFKNPFTCTEYHLDAQGNPVEGEYLGKDVGNCVCEGNEDNSILSITITNAYPSYRVKCPFKLKNEGDVPLTIEDITVIDPSGTLTWNSEEEALEDTDGNPIISITLILSTIQLNPEEVAEATIHIHIEQDAEECSTYRFQVTIPYCVVIENG